MASRSRSKDPSDATPAAAARRYRGLMRAPLAAVRRGKGVVAVLLVGSRARGDHTEESDVDVVLVLRDGPSHSDRVDAATCERAFRRAVPRGLWVDLHAVRARELERRLRCTIADALEGSGGGADPDGALRAVRDGVPLLGGRWLSALRARHAEGLAETAHILRFPALEPDVGDGLSTIDRGLLLAFARVGIEADGKHRKCVRVVDACAEESHPFGRSLIFERLLHLARDFTSRQTLADPQGNVGSVDGDPAASRRYSEVRPSQLAAALFCVPRPTESLEALGLPATPRRTAGPLMASLARPIGARLPSCLLTGWQDPREGAADAIPPFALGEVADAVAALLADPGLSLAALLQHMPGPDFAVGGEVGPRAAIRELYATGRATLTHAASGVIEGSGDAARVVMAGVPWGRTRYNLLIPLSRLTAAGRLGEVDVCEHEGLPAIRVAVRAGERPERVLARVRRAAPVETHVRAELRVLVEGEPRVLPMLELLRRFVDAQLDLLRARTARELARLEERLAIVEGLSAAAGAGPRLAQIVAKAASLADARAEVARSLGLSDAQAEAVLRDGLALLPRDRRAALRSEQEALSARSARLRDASASEASLRALLREEILALKAAHADARRTRLV